ncbi:DegT/DnrJ/EryC1/StrS family aminotransferase [Streptomyces niveus]|uniref:DegT/DnrJ/EryC1/StrS family aminotransferase n=1 Tax=Streptomyces niveus TaxID=193462 RepID=UPI00371B6772
MLGSFDPDDTTSRRTSARGVGRPLRSAHLAQQIHCQVSGVAGQLKLTLTGLGQRQVRRQELWRAYAAGLADLGVGLIDVDIDRTVPFNCVVRIRERDTVHAVLRDRGIGVGVHYPPNHLQPAFARWRRELPVTEQIAGEIMSLPFHPAMTAADATDVVPMLGQSLEALR